MNGLCRNDAVKLTQIMDQLSKKPLLMNACPGCETKSFFAVPPEIDSLRGVRHRVNDRYPIGGERRFNREVVAMNCPRCRKELFLEVWNEF
jgi:hypothetical protein